jgi:hypothetical protein
MKRIGKADLVELYNTMQVQMLEDRKAVVELYNDLKSRVLTLDEYALHGLTLARYAELMEKQTALMLEVIKLGYKNSEKENTDLTDDEKDVVYDRIENKGNPQ